MTNRVTPPRCTTCSRDPWLCPSCGDFQCACPNPYLVQLTNPPRLIPRVHYQKNGKPYPMQYVDGYEPGPYPTEEEDLTWLIEGGFGT